MSRHLLYLGPDQTDVAVTRRVAGLRKAGLEVSAYAFERASGCAPGLNSLGRAEDGAIRARITAVRSAVSTLRRDFRAGLQGIDAIYARNLDLALAALYLQRELPRPVPLFYEVLDIHPMLSAPGPKGRLARWLERLVLRRCAGLVTSSPGFLEAYFDQVQSYAGPVFLFENKVEGLDRPAGVSRPGADRPEGTDGPGRLTIVYAGKLRCHESLDLLTELARARPDRVHIRLAGGPISLEPVPRAFDRLVAQPNVTDTGRYAYPDGLANIYSGADLNWACDFQSDFNARQLVPNRLYEGGLFAVPPIVRAWTATARRAADWQVGLEIEPPYLESLLRLVDAGPQPRLAQQERLRHMAPEAFAISDDYDRLAAFLAQPGGKGQ